MYQDSSRFYTDYVGNPYATQFGVNSRYALPTASAQTAAKNACYQQNAGRVWRCTSRPGSCRIYCRPVRRHPCCMDH